MPFLRTMISHPLERERGAVVASGPGLPIVAKTLGEAIESAEKYFNVRIVAHDPPKWFRVYGLPGHNDVQYLSVDIHVRRNGQDICPKQDVSFPLQESDVVNIGALAC